MTDMLYHCGMEHLYIFGAGEFAQIASTYFLEEGKYDFKGFIVDDNFLCKETISLESPVYGYSVKKEVLSEQNTRVFVAISAAQMNLDRSEVYSRLKLLGCRFATYISPMSYVSKHASVGENVFIFEENVVQNGVDIGNDTILWSGNHIGHQSRIGSHVFFSSHVVVSGYCKIENHCYFGVNSTLVDHITIASGTLVGAGSLILKDTESNSVYVGSPAKKIEGRNPYKVIFR